jgi:hypothetical protein
MSLSWHVPTTGDPRLLRLALAQVGLASIVAALLLVFAAPREWVAPGILGLIPLAIFMAYRRWSAYRRSLEGNDNVRIDEAGVHWIDAAGQERSFARRDVVGFHIASHAETLRPVSALTLSLAGGLESQPIELHPPATPGNVRDLLRDGWQLPERTPVATDDYDSAVFVYSECHEEFCEWHWEGTKEQLARFFALFAAAADELPLPPAGAKPAARIVLASRREPARISVGHSLVAHVGDGAIHAPAAVLREIASLASAALAAVESAGDVKFEVGFGPEYVWTFYLHVRDS